ncbi:hypothetical protein Tco_1006240 [Tanacetum coccineum]|uniref:Uncharacterized protein n=1 Tax=Tanacetum coccineum TaxID=301880 RepID=A0ABQ5FJH9_9ASTR
MIVQAQEQEGEGSVMPTVPQHTPIINQPSSSQPQKKEKPRKSKKQNTKVSQPSDSIEPIADEAPNDESVPTHSNDPLLSGEERLKLNELMELYTNLSQRVLDVKNTNTYQAAEITKLKERVKKLERRNKSRTPGLKRLRKGRKITDIGVNEEVTLIDETQGRNDDNLMFDTGVLDEQEVKVEKTLIEIKAAKPKAITTAAKTTTTAVTRPKAKGVVVQEPSEFTTTTSPSQPSQLPQPKDKGKAKMVEHEKPLKKKDQILIDEEIAQRLQEELQAELEEEERLARQKEKDANIAKWDHVQGMIDADYELVARLQAQEHEEFTIEERSKMFVELMDKRKKHFARLRAEEQESSSKRADDELEQEKAKKQKIDDDEAEMKKHIDIVPDDEVAIDAIPLATKPPIIKLVKAKHRSSRPEEGYERVLWGDLKVMFEPDLESEVWRNLQGHNVTVWKLFSSSGVHFVRFQNLHIFMLVEKKYPLTPATITKMLNKKIQADHWNEMCYQLLKLMTKQLKNPESV